MKELPRTREKWFKTTITKDVEFRSYLKPEHRDIVQKKSVPSTWLEERWQQLLKAILVYITCEGRYNRAMIYHFKLMNHFIGRSPLNLPFYLHKSLTKMAHQVNAQPTKIVGRLSHHGLIQLVYARNCFQTTRKQANIISNISIKQNWVFRVFLRFSGCEVW